MATTMTMEELSQDVPSNHLERDTFKRRKIMAEDPELSLSNPNVVGLLLKTENGVTREFAIILNKALWIGRSPACEVVIDRPKISARHLRVYAIATSTELNLAILHDTSVNGFYLNGQQCGKIENRIGGKAVNSRSVILRDGDTILFPDSKAVFTYTQPRQIPRDKEITNDLRKHLLFSGLYTNESITLDPWVIHNYPLGHGTWGLVNLGTHTTRPSQQFAIKTVLLSRQTETNLNLRREVKIHRAIDHPNNVRLLDYVWEKEGTDEAGDGASGKLHLVMDLVTGGDLWSYIGHYKPLREDEVRWIAWQMTDALKYLHENGIVHRDLKPENILLHTAMAYPRILVADFGHATTLSQIRSTLLPAPQEPAGYYRQFEQIGTTQYFPPEHCKWMLDLADPKEEPNMVYMGSKEEVAEDWFEAQCAMDMWATGVTLWFCANGSHPYYGLQDPQWHGYGDGMNTYTYSEINLSRSPTGFSSTSSSTSTIRQFSSNSTIRQYQHPSCNSGDKRRDRDSPPDDDIEHSTLMNTKIAGVQEESSRPHVWGENDVIDTWRQIKLFSRMDSSQWSPTEHWVEWSNEGIAFLQSALSHDPAQRLRSSTGHDEAWFVGNEEEIEDLRQKVLINGEVIRHLL
ncbi:hypothetical protein IAT40_004270 [Kwoniella sp. CBS 6097]